MTRRSLSGLLIGCAIWLAIGTCARAGTVDDFVFSAGVFGSEIDFTFAQLAAKSETVILPDGSTTTATLLNGQMGTEEWEITWSKIEFDPDPFISFVGGFTNLLATPTDFTFTTTTPVAPLASSLMAGSTIVTVQDADFLGGATLKNITGMPGYSGTIDGANALDMLDPFSISAPAGFASETTPGYPATLIPDGPVTATIGITHRFNLTGMDNATFNSTFRVTPEPSSFVLAGIGVLGLLYGAWRRRRM